MVEGGYGGPFWVFGGGIGHDVVLGVGVVLGWGNFGVWYVGVVGVGCWCWCLVFVGSGGWGVGGLGGLMVLLLLVIKWVLCEIFGFLV